MPGIPLPPSHGPRHAAKQLRQAALAGDAAALQRLRRIYADLGKPNPPAAGLSLTRCQHVIARESGFASWNAMLASQAKPKQERRFLVVDEMWSSMNSEQEQRIPRIRAMLGVPDELYRIREDGLVFCAQALAHAVSASGQELTQGLIDRLLPGMWRPAAEAVERWGVPSKPYSLVDGDRGVRIRHDPFHAFLPGSFSRGQAYEIIGQLIIGRYQAAAPGRCTWRGIPLEPIDDLDWRHLGAPPLAVDAAADPDPGTGIQPENPLVSSTEQHALAAHHQAWKRALQPFIHRAIRLHETDGTRLNGLPWQRIAGDEDPAFDADAAEVRELVIRPLPPAIPNAILSGYHHEVTHGFTDSETLIWRIIGEYLVGRTVDVGYDASLVPAAQFAVARWLDGLSWDAAADEARTVGAYDRRLLAIVNRVDQANSFIAGAHPQPPRVGPPWRNVHESFEAMVRLCRHVGGGKPIMLTQSAADFDRHGVSPSR